MFFGQSNFHASGIALSTNLPTYVLDPYFNEVREITEFAQKLKKKQHLQSTKQLQKQNFWGNCRTQRRTIIKVFGLKFKRELEKEGKEVQLFA